MTGAEMAIAGATVKLSKRLLVYQENSVLSLLSGIDSRFQNPKIAHAPKKGPDFRCMPLGPSAAAHSDLPTRSNSEIGWAIGNCFSEVDVSAVRNQAPIARVFVKENHSRFKRPVDENGLSKGVGLVVMGKESILDYPFESSVVCSSPIDMCLQISDFMTQFM